MTVQLTKLKRTRLKTLRERSYSVIRLRRLEDSRMKEALDMATSPSRNAVSSLALHQRSKSTYFPNQWQYQYLQQSVPIGIPFSMSASWEQWKSYRCIINSITDHCHDATLIQTRLRIESSQG